MKGPKDPNMGSCQNYGPLLGPQILVPYYTKDPKRDHSFDNHPYGVCRVFV